MGWQLLGFSFISIVYTFFFFFALPLSSSSLTQHLDRYAIESYLDVDSTSCLCRCPCVFVSLCARGITKNELMSEEQGLDLLQETHISAWNVYREEVLWMEPWGRQWFCGWADSHNPVSMWYILCLLDTAVMTAGCNWSGNYKHSVKETISRATTLGSWAWKCLGDNSCLLQSMH